MLDERAKREADEAREAPSNRKWDRIRDETFEMIDRAAPFIDEGCAPNKWPPSAKLKLLYFVSATNGLVGGEKRAIQTILQMLDRARRLWVEGLDPDPWADEPKVHL